MTYGQLGGQVMECHKLSPVGKRMFLKCKMLHLCYSQHCVRGGVLLLFIILRLHFRYENLCPVSIAALGDKIVRDIRPGAAFEPTYIYRLLTVIKSSLSEKVWHCSHVASRKFASCSALCLRRSLSRACSALRARGLAGASVDLGLLWSQLLE